MTAALRLPAPEIPDLFASGCPVCTEEIRVGERRIPRFGTTIHQHCASDATAHECGQVVHETLEDIRWLNDAHDATVGQEVVTASGERYEIVGQRWVDFPDAEQSDGGPTLLLVIKLHEPATAEELRKQEGAEGYSGRQLETIAENAAHYTLDAQDINENPRVIIE